MSHKSRARGPLLLAPLLGLAVFLPLCTGVHAADGAPAGRRYALLVGVRNYAKDELRNLEYTENDVNDLARVLRDAGYRRIIVLTQSEAAAQRDNDLLPTGKNIRDQLRGLLEDRGPEDSVLVAFSGHGVQPRGAEGSYFCPMDAKIRDLTTLVALAEVYKALDESKAGVKALLVDACRNDPLAGGDKGAPKMDLKSVTRPPTERPPGGVGALFSCSEDEQSYESAKFKHGVFFHFVIQGLKGEAANKKGEVTFQGLAAYVTDETPDEAKEEWGPRARQHPEWAGKLGGSEPLVTAVNREEMTNTIGMKLRRIKPGMFLMGSPNNEKVRNDDEGPRHEVEITRPFYMGATPVTRGQFEMFVDAESYKTEAEKDGKGRGYQESTRRFVNGPTYNWRDPGFAQTDSHPVVNVTWNDAVKFCKWLSNKEGNKYELPTEAEWEYACRAGTTTRFWCGDRDEDLKGNANVADASLKDKLDASDAKNIMFQPWDDGYPFTSPVRRFKANSWGLCDMHGNVWQWCADRYGPYHEEPIKDPKGSADGDHRVLRGGSWGYDPRVCRSAVRGNSDAGDRNDGVGFRVVLRLSAGTP